MSKQIHESVLRNPIAMPDAVDKFVAAALAIVGFFHALADVPNELLRMADEHESSRPELATRLRKAVRLGWGW